MKKPRIYIDTSVIGGCFDAEFSEASNALVDMARDGKAILVFSDLLEAEVRRAPARVGEVFYALPHECVELVTVDQEANTLRDAYVNAGVVGSACHDDALHVALASVARCDLIVSWNFKHIVHYDKIRGYNAVNLFNGYPIIAIHSPKEVV